MITNKYLIFFKLKNMVFHKLSTFKKRRKKTKSVKKKRPSEKSEGLE